VLFCYHPSLSVSGWWQAALEPIPADEVEWAPGNEMDG
jgi:hypothetical protein